jgi:hypothetical protein
MVGSNNGNKDMNKGNDADKAGTYSDGLIRLVEEQDKDGNVCYCIECATTGDLLYSSASKPQAYSFCEVIARAMTKALANFGSLNPMTITAMTAVKDIWCFTSKYGIDNYKSLISFLDDKDMKKETVENVADGWEQRSVELQAASIRWEKLFDGPLSNRAIYEYFARSRARHS